jgi:hypothetical protein
MSTAPSAGEREATTGLSTPVTDLVSQVIEATLADPRVIIAVSSVGIEALRAILTGNSALTQQRLIAAADKKGGAGETA